METKCHGSCEIYNPIKWPLVHDMLLNMYWKAQCPTATYTWNCQVPYLETYLELSGTIPRYTAHNWYIYILATGNLVASPFPTNFQTFTFNLVSVSTWS